MDTNTIAMIILFATFMIFMVLRVPVTFSMLGACVLTALYLGPKYVSSVFLRLGDGVQSFSFLAIMYLRMLFRIKIFMMEFTFPILTEWPEGFFLFAWSDLNIQKNREPGWNFQLQIWGFSGR